ncbi:hypothetical protein BHE74_00025119, partial [Ensete ventricosum]
VKRLKEARNVYREELVDCVRQCAWYRISLFSRWKQRGMYATCMWVVELLLVLSNTDSVFCYVPEFYLESLVNVDSFHALRKSDPSFVSSAIFIKQGLASFVSRSAIPNYSTCIGRYVLVRPQIDTQRARYWAVSSIGAIFALISIVAARYRAILAEGEGRRGRRGRRKGRTWRSGIALLRRSQSVVVLSRHSLDSIDEMSPPLLRQRGLGVVGDFSSAWGEEAPTISLRFLSRVGRRNEARWDHKVVKGLSSFQWLRSVRRPCQYQEKTNRTIILAPLVGIITSLMDASTNLEQMELNDVVGVFVNMDCPATVFQCLLGYNWSNVLRGDASLTKLAKLDEFSSNLRSRTEAIKRTESCVRTGDEEGEDFCCICYACNSDAMFEPCHHKSCHGCITRHLLNGQRCFFCNAVVTSVVKLEPRNPSWETRGWFDY